MAITATIALSSATAKALQPVTATVTVSNSGAAAVNVLNIVPKGPINGTTPQTTSVVFGAAPLGPGMTVSVAASGSSTFSFGVVAEAPTTNNTNFATPASLVYSIGADVYTSDNAITAATPATLTVTNPAGL